MAQPLVVEQINGELLHNYKHQIRFRKPDRVREIGKRRLMWASCAWRQQWSPVRQVIRIRLGKIPLGWSRLRWRDCVKKIEPGNQFEGRKKKNISQIFMQRTEIDIRSMHLVVGSLRPKSKEDSEETLRGYYVGIFHCCLSIGRYVVFSYAQ